MLVLLDDAGLVEGGFHLQDRLLAVLEHRVESAQHRHRQDHVAVLAAHVQVAQDVVGDAPDVVRDPVEVAVAHVGAAARRGLWAVGRCWLPGICIGSTRGVERTTETGPAAER